LAAGSPAFEVEANVNRNLRWLIMPAALSPPKTPGAAFAFLGAEPELAATAVEAVAATALTAISTLDNLGQSLSIPGVVLETCTRNS
jgi:hypothetical protein